MRTTKIIQDKPYYRLFVRKQENSTTENIHTVEIVRETLDSEGNLEVSQVDQYNFSTEELQRFAESFLYYSR
jgi:hypothetical protein